MQRLNYFKLPGLYDDWTRILIVLALASVSFSFLSTLFMPDEYISMVVVAPIGLLGLLVVSAYPKAALVLVIAYLPFQNTGWLDGGLPSVFTANKLFGILLLGSFAFNVLFRGRAMRFCDELQDYVILSFCVVMFFSGMTSPLPNQVFSDFDRLLRLVAFYFLVKNLVDDPKILRAVLYALLIPTAIASASGIYESLTVTTEWGNRIRASGIDMNGNLFALYCIFGVAAGVALLRSETRYFARVIVAVLLGTIVASIILSGSRGVLIGLVSAVGVFIIRQPNRVQVLLIIAVIMVISYFFLPTNIRTRYLGGSDSDFENEYEAIAERSVERRRGYIDFGISAFAERPVLGWGFRTFSRLYAQSEVAGEANQLDRADRLRVAHNVYLETIVGLGFVGFSILLVVLANAWRLLYYSGALLRDGGVMWATSQAFEYALIVFAIASVFQSSEFMESFWLLLGIASVLFYRAGSTQMGIPQ